MEPGDFGGLEWRETLPKRGFENGWTRAYIITWEWRKVEP